jgi:hypothetical protein
MQLDKRSVAQRIELEEYILPDSPSWEAFRWFIKSYFVWGWDFCGMVIRNSTAY